MLALANLVGQTWMDPAGFKSYHFPNLHALDLVCSWGLDATTRFQFSHHVTALEATKKRSWNASDPILTNYGPGIHNLGWTQTTRHRTVRNHSSMWNLQRTHTRLYKKCTVNPIQKCMRGSSWHLMDERQNMQFELAATTRKKQWMCGSHINRHGDEKGCSDQRRYNSNNLCCLKRKHTP